MIVRKGWQDALALRQAVLGYPPRELPGDADEATQHLFLVDADHRELGVVSCTPHACPLRPATPAFYLWATAVVAEAQRRGFGTRLVCAVLAIARDAGAKVVWADARLSAVAFYERLGATREGDVYRDDVTGLDDQRVVFDL